MSTTLQILMLLSLGLSSTFAKTYKYYIVLDEGVSHVEESCASVVDTAAAAGLTTLLAAVEAAGLVETVNDPNAGLTIFAPTDAAFSAALDALGLTLEEVVGNTNLLTQILTYHVLPTPEMSSSLAEKGSLATLLGDNSLCGKSDLSFSDENGAFTVIGGASSATVVDANIGACTTIIHVIDNVLLPCPPPKPVEEKAAIVAKKTGDKLEEAETPEEGCLTVVEAAEAASLTTLLIALTAAGVDDVIKNPGAGFTIFAPTDAAFGLALRSVGVSFEELFLNKELLTQILTYHAIPTPETASSLAEKGTLKTLLGDSSPCGQPNLSFKDEDGAFTIVGGASSAKVLLPDVKTCSSIIHVIDNVLLSCGA